jgi:hypothetical protein
MTCPHRQIAAAALAAGLCSTATADFYDAVVYQYFVTATDFGGPVVEVYVQDVYLVSNESDLQLLNVYNWNTVGGAASYFQSFTGAGWQPTNLGGPFDTTALQQADSFVTIGGFGSDALQAPGAGSNSVLDPNFGGNNAAAPGVDAGWYNASPDSLPGAVMTYSNGVQGTLIGRFTSTVPFSLVGTTFEATWNQGLGTPGQQAAFTISQTIGESDCNQNGIPDADDIINGVLTDCNGDQLADECQIPAPQFESGVLACPLNGTTLTVNLTNAPFVSTGESRLFLDINADLSGPDRYLDIVVGDQAQVTTRINDLIACGDGLSFVSLPGYAQSWGTGGVVPMTITASPAVEASCTDSIRVRVGDASLDTDCDGDGVFDTCEIADGSEIDCDGDGLIDRCFSATHSGGSDCDGDGLNDACEVADGSEPDCNANGVPDACDIADGTVTDHDGDGVPDSCESLAIVGTDATTIAAAISMVDDGGIVVVPAGTYSAPITLDRPILIVAPDGPEATVITNAGAPRTIVSAHGAPSGAVLRGFTITNGVGVSGLVGGGVDAIDSHLRLEGCVLRSNFGTDGGGARFFGGAPTIVDCIFDSNRSSGVGGGLRLISSDATVSDCAFRVNEADGGSGLALAVTDGVSSIHRIDVELHAAQAVRFEDTDGVGSADLVDARIHDNTQQGVLVVSDRPDFVALVNSRVCGNDAPGSPVVGPFTDGGGNILLSDRCPDLVVPDDADTIQMAINAALDGERIAVRQGDLDHVGFSFSGRDVEVIAVPGPELVRITGPVLAIDGEPATALLRGFEVRDGLGIDSLSGREGTVVGGNLVLDGSSLTVEECRIQFGEAEYGGGAFIRGGGATILNCYITANRATAEGGGIYVDGSEAMSVSMSGLIVAGNFLASEPHTRGGGVRVGGDQATVTMGGVAICSNERENLAGTVTESGANSICLAFDCDANGVEDAADIADFGRADCNGNLVPDDCDIAGGLDTDCDVNGVLDSCDLANGAPDLDLDGVLDVCQSQLVFSVPERFGSIGDAINAATNGSRIALASGNYNEAVNLGSKNLEIVGDPADPASVELDGFELGSTVLTIAGGQDASTRIAGVTIKQGIADMPEPGSPANLVGGGLYIDGASPIVEDCIITTNDAARGGGAYVRDSSATIRRTIIEANTAAAGAGIWWSGGQIAIEDCTIRDNTAEGNGGGLRLATDGGSIVGGSITGNLAADDGAGVWWQGSISPLAFDGVTISGNIAGGEGGGVLAKFAAPGVTFANSTVCDNAPDEITGPYDDLGGNDLCVCPWDLSGNGVVGAEDVGILLSQWGLCPDGCSADFDGDGLAGAADLGSILGAWGVCP